MKVFISYGMHGRSKEAQEIVKSNMVDFAKQIYGEDIETIDNSDARGGSEDGRLYYLGQAVQKIDKCDAMLFEPLWRKYKGCTIEHAIAKIYGIPYKEIALIDIEQ